MPMKLVSKASRLNAQSVRFALQRENLVAQLQQSMLVGAVNKFLIKSFGKFSVPIDGE